MLALEWEKEEFFSEAAASAHPVCFTDNDLLKPTKRCERRRLKTTKQTVEQNLLSL